MMQTKNAAERKKSMIIYDEAARCFHLRGDKVSYVMQVEEDAQVHHLYWGDALQVLPKGLYDRAPYRRAQLVEHQAADSPKCTREFQHTECPTYGLSDFRQPALATEIPSSGDALCDLCYVSYEITPGREPIPGLPYAQGDADTETLTLHLADPCNGIQATLYYHLFPRESVITRHMTVCNGGQAACCIRQAMSATVDFEDGCFDLLTLDGTTLREFTPSLRRLAPGVTEVGSTRGISSHQHNPNIALLRPGADQQQGQVYGLSLLYSGNFTLRCEVDQYGSLRLQGGIHPQRFTWRLEPGASFDTPEAVLSYTHAGLNGLSALLHPFVRHHLTPKSWRERPRPVLLNTWEACYFDINEPRLRETAAAAQELGIRLMVIDDGWFGHRMRADSSLGDWYPCKEKFPAGLEPLRTFPLPLGIWMEPEMISPDSDLYRQHPDWCLHAPGRVRTEWRNQLVLDMSRREVQDYLIGCIDAVLSTGIFSYVKWDNNRRMTQVQSAAWPAEQQGELFHRCMLGTYRLFDHIRTQYPEVLLENCASGGGRFDYGMLCYCPQGWLSDNTDPVDRLMQQHTASIFYPPETITSHIACSPNHQTQRVTPIGFRRDVCALFNAGFELDVTALDSTEKQAIAEAAALFADMQPLMVHGKFTRLNRETAPDAWFGWMAEDEQRAVVAYFRPFCRQEAAYWTIPLHGLERDTLYRDTRDGTVLSGADWEAWGLRPIWREGDFFSELIVLEKVRR